VETSYQEDLGMQSVETPQKQLIRLFGSYKAEWLKELIFDLFTVPAYFPELKSPFPCVLEGGRGTGKTTVLKGLSYQGQFALSGRDPEAITNWEFIGLYYRVDTNRVTAFKGPELTEEKWSHLFAHYFNVIICGLVLEFLEWYQQYYPDVPKLSESDIITIATSLHLSNCRSSRDLLAKLSTQKTSFEAYINNVGDSGSYPLSMQGAPIDAMTSAVMRLPQFKGKQFYILIDEYENLEDYQQQVVNTLIKHTKDEYTFKIGVRELGWRQRTTLNINEKLNSTADYVLIPIVDKLEGDKFKSFAEKVCNMRISRLELPERQAITDVREVLASLTEDEEAELLGVMENVKEIKEEIRKQLSPDELGWFDTLTSLQVYFLRFWAEAQNVDVVSALLDWRANRQEWDERYQNYKHACLYTIRKGKRGIHKYYAGWDVFVKMAGGNIRYLLELVDQSFLAHLQVDELLKHQIDVKTQTFTAQNVGKKNLSDLAGLSIHGAQLTKLLLGLGRIFQVMAAEVKGHTPEVNQFHIKPSDNLSYEQRETINQIIIAAVMHLALVRSPGNKLGHPGDTKDYDYMVHPIFSAFFEYSYRRKRKLLLEEIEVYNLIHKPKETISDILKRSNRPEREALPQQLSLFESYYEGD
jgi:hypothetical protein